MTEVTEEQTKTKRKPLLLGVLAAVLALFLATVVILQPTNASAFASVNVLEDKVSARQGDGPMRPLDANTSLGEGTSLQTDSTGMAELDYFDGSLMRLGPGSEYRLETLQEGDSKAIVGNLEIGRTFHRVNELSGSQRYEVRTANAVASVRGTEFLVICETRGLCEFGVIKGTVGVTSRETGQVVLLGPGQEVTVNEDGTLSEVRPLDLTDAWLSLNLQIDGVDLDDLRVELFGPDEQPGTADDPPPPPRVLGESAAGPGGGGPGGGGPADDPPPRVLGETVEGGPGGDGPGDNSTTTRPGATTTTARPGSSTTTTRPSGTTTTTRPGSTTTTGPPRTTSTTANNCTTGYPPRPC